MKNEKKRTVEDVVMCLTAVKVKTYYRRAERNLRKRTQAMVNDNSPNAITRMVMATVAYD